MHYLWSVPSLKLPMNVRDMIYNNLIFLSYTNQNVFDNTFNISMVCKNSFNKQ